MALAGDFVSVISVANLADGNGLSATGEWGFVKHDTDANHMWLSEKGKPNGAIEFDFGKELKLESIKVWNYNLTGRTNRGIKKTDISVWTQSTGWKKVLNGFEFTEADGTNDYDEPVCVQIGAVDAQKIRFDNIVNFGDKDYIGLSEVEFFKPRGVVAIWPQPDDGARCASLSELRLRWAPGADAAVHKVFVGIEPDKLDFMGAIKGEDNATAILTSLTEDSKYFWRVDEVQKNGSTAAGKVWSFTTPAKLVGWWKFDEPNGMVAYDSSVNAFHANIIYHDPCDPCAPPNWVTGKIGGAYNFKYRGRAVAPNNTMNDCTDKLTMAFWLKSPTGYDDATEAIAPFSAYKGGGYAINCAWLPDSKTNTGKHGVMKWYCGQDWNDVQGIISDPNAYSGRWNHWALTKNSKEGTLKMYLNGQLFASSLGHKTPFDWTGNSNSFEIGTFWTHANGWAYHIDDFRIYNFELTQDEIAGIYSGKELAKSAIAMMPKMKPDGEKTGEGTKQRNFIPVLVIFVVAIAVAALVSRRKKQ